MEARLQEGGGVIAPTALPQTLMREDDLDRGGAAETAFPPPAEERGGAVSGNHRAPWSGTHRGEMELSRGTAESHSSKGSGGSTPLEEWEGTREK